MKKEREILHERFLSYLTYLEEQEDLIWDLSSGNRSPYALSRVLEIDLKQLNSYIQHEHLITFQEAYKFCEHYGVNEQEMFSDISNYLDKVICNSGKTIKASIKVNAGKGIADLLPSELKIIDIQGIKGKYAFQIQCASMNPKYLPGQWVLCERILKPMDVKDNKAYVIFFKTSQPRLKYLVKWVTNKLKGFVLISENEYENPKDHILIDEVDSIYEVVNVINDPV
jgi:hypothetical protein